MIRLPVTVAALALLTTFVEAADFSGKFRGEYMCGAMPTLPGMLRTPLDIVIDKDRIEFARPLFNAEGTRVVGTELAAGKIDADGRASLESQWALRGAIANARYSGSFTPQGGTLVGDQTWTRDDHSAVRTCVAAVVPAPGSGP